MTLWNPGEVEIDATDEIKISENINTNSRQTEQRDGISENSTYHHWTHLSLFLTDASNTTRIK